MTPNADIIDQFAAAVAQRVRPVVPLEWHSDTIGDAQCADNPAGARILRSATGFASPYYGKLGVASLPSEVKTIWYSRDDELPELPRYGWSWEQVTEPDHESLDLALKILAATPLTEREAVAIRLMVLEGCTLEEAGREMDCTRSRVQQLVIKGLRRLRTHQEVVTGIRPDDIYGDVTTWWFWSRYRSAR